MRCSEPGHRQECPAMPRPNELIPFAAIAGTMPDQAHTPSSEFAKLPRDGFEIPLRKLEIANHPHEPGD